MQIFCSLLSIPKTFVYQYDYILIDCPTQSLFFSQSSLYASDVVLIPTKHNGLASLHNAARVITNFIPEIKQERGDGGPIALPIFFNLSTNKIGGFENIDAETTADAIFNASKGKWKSLTPISKLEPGLDTAKMKTFKTLFTL